MTFMLIIMPRSDNTRSDKDSTAKIVRITVVLYIIYPQLMTGAPADKHKLAKLEDALKIFDTYLDGHKYAAGDTLTTADLSLIATVSSFEASDVDFLKYTNVKRWYETVKTTAPGYQEANEKGLEAFKAIVQGMRK